MDWIENHGEAFLSKHTGVGKSLHRARALQKRHDDFEDVAQVSPEAVMLPAVTDAELRCHYFLYTRHASVCQTKAAQHLYLKFMEYTYHREPLEP